MDSKIPLSTAKDEIVSALSEFDFDLGQRARNIFGNEDQLNIVEVEEHTNRVMACRPAGVTIPDLKASDMYIPDYAERFGPHFTEQENLTDSAIIDFEYDGTPRSIVWLGHELGHAIADGVHQDNGHTFRDFSQSEMEEQAYFIQKIVSQHVRSKFREPDLKDDDLKENPIRMSWERAAQFTNAGKMYEKAVDSEQDVRRNIVIQALDQRTVDDISVTTQPSGLIATAEKPSI